MKHWVGKQAKICILKEGRRLFFNGVVQSVTDTHFSFIDRYSKSYSFPLEDVDEVSEA